MAHNLMDTELASLKENYVRLKQQHVLKTLSL